MTTQAPSIDAQLDAIHLSFTHGDKTGLLTGLQKLQHDFATLRKKNGSIAEHTPLKVAAANLAEIAAYHWKSTPEGTKCRVAEAAATCLVYLLHEDHSLRDDIEHEYCELPLDASEQERLIAERMAFVVNAMPLPQPPPEEPVYTAEDSKALQTLGLVDLPSLDNP